MVLIVAASVTLSGMSDTVFADNPWQHDRPPREEAKNEFVQPQHENNQVGHQERARLSHNAGRTIRKVEKRLNRHGSY